MPLDHLKDTRSRWSILSKVDQLGAIDFWTLTISLDALKPEDIAGLSVSDLEIPKDTVFNFAEYGRRKAVLPLAVHEYTHFIDATSSLWGMHHLHRINACHSVDMRSEDQYCILKQSHDYMRSIRFPEYYTTIDRSLPTDRPWGYRTTSGVMFSSDGKVSDRPIIFMNFLTANGERIVRSPLSTVSLLEASAMAQELEVRIRLIEHLKEDEKSVERRLFEAEIMQHIYNRELTEYSACFHLLANLQNETDLAITSWATGLLCRIILNAPEIAFKTACKNVNAYAKKMGLSDTDLEVTRIASALNQLNHGILFYIIATLLEKGALKSMKRFIDSLERSLKMIGLSIEKLRRGAYEEAEKLGDELSKSTLSSIRILAERGHGNFRKLFPEAIEYPLEQLALPPAVLGDENMTRYVFHSNQSNPLKDFDLEHAYNELVQCQLKSEKFAEACI